MPKTPNPEDEDELCPISIIDDMAKDYNNFLAEWLQPYLQKNMDPSQLGGVKGGSIVHYLILLFNFIFQNTDNSAKPHAVIATLVDLSKGFTRINHNKVIIRLSDWGVPGWILRIVTSYLTGRTMQVRYKGATSKPYNLPGGGPQGDLLGMIVFLVEMSDVGMDLPPTATTNNKNDVNSVPAPPPPTQTEKELRLKFMDDLTLAEAVRLDTNLSDDGNGLILPPSRIKLQVRLNDLKTYTDIHDMKVNQTKTKVIPFNFCRKYNFTPQFTKPNYSE